MFASSKDTQRWPFVVPSKFRSGGLLCPSVYLLRCLNVSVYLLVRVPYNYIITNRAGEGVGFGKWVRPLEKVRQNRTTVNSERRVRVSGA